MLTPRIKAALAAGIGFAILAGAVYGGWWLRDLQADRQDAEWQSRWDKQVADLAEAKAKATEEARNEEQRRQAAIHEVNTNAQFKIDQAQADAAAARATANSLRDQAKRLAAAAGKACSNPGAANAGTAASTTSMVLADLFGRADQTAGELAAAYDRARIAGLACERTYNALTPSSGAQ